MKTYNIEIMTSISLFLPAIITNLMLNIFYEIKRKCNLLWLDYPLDLNLNLGKNRLLGDSTTIGGFIVSIICGLGLSFVPFFQYTLTLSLLSYFGHALGSFIKRRLGIPRGNFLPIVDHGDYMILSSIYFVSLDVINYKYALLCTILVMIIQPVFAYLSWRLGIREDKI